MACPQNVLHQARRDRRVEFDKDPPASSVDVLDLRPEQDRFEDVVGEKRLGHLGIIRVWQTRGVRIDVALAS